MKYSEGSNESGSELVLDGLTEMQSLIVLYLYDNPDGIDANYVVSGVLSKLSNKATAGDIYGALDYLQGLKLVVRVDQGGDGYYYLERSVREKIYMSRQH